VTSFRVKADKTESSIEAGGLTSLLGGRLAGGPSGYNQKKTNLKTQLGVDLRIVEPTTGKLLVSKFSEFDRTDSAESLGISILGFGTQNDAEIQVTEDDAGRVLRLAFDDAIKKMLPELDAKLAAAGRRPTGAASAAPAPASAAPVAVPTAAPAPVAPAAAPAAPAVPAPASAVPPIVAEASQTAPPAPASAARSTDDAAGTVVAKKFCPECGDSVTAAAKFCPKDGTKIQ
jgi:hypothetical protein